MVALSKIREGGLVQLPNSILEYYIRGKAKNGRVQLICFTLNHDRYSHLDRNYPKDTKVIPYTPNNSKIV